MMPRVLLAALVVALPGPGGRSGDDLSPVETVQGSWRLEALVVEDMLYPLDSPRPRPLSLEVEGVHATGSGGCNQFGANVTEDDATLAFHDLSSTLIGCPGAVGKVEAAYFEGLAGVTTATLDGSGLVLTGKDVTMTFRATDEGGGDR